MNTYLTPGIWEEKAIKEYKKLAQEWKLLSDLIDAQMLADITSKEMIEGSVDDLAILSRYEERKVMPKPALAHETPITVKWLATPTDHSY